MNNSIHQLHQLGQSLWYDNIDRRLLEDGTLQGMIDRGEIRGVTSNPSIFNKAIGQSSTYNEDIKTFTQAGLSREEIYERLAVADIQKAADFFDPLFQDSGGGDGFVSLEVSPYLARDTEGTLEEARHLWEVVDRPNLMVKIPATREGLPAVRQATALGININITLIFSLARYRKVMDAYLGGLEDRLEAGEDISGIHSVASFFISRIETKVDDRLAALQEAGKMTGTEIKTLRGQAAVASGKVAYQAYQQVLGEANSRYQRLVEQGANRQRVLWASTSTKNPRYSDVKYVEEMIGPETVNTVPQRTLEAFLDHGEAAITIDQEVEEAREALQDLEEAGVDLEEVTRELEEEGVAAFAESFTALLETIQERKETLT